MRSTSIWILLLPLVSGAAGEVPDVAQALDRTRAALTAIVAGRDRAITAINARMAADSAVAPPVDLTLEVTEILNHASLNMELSHRGGRFLGGTGSLATYNKGIHTLDGTKLILDKETLRGTLLVSLNPDSWSPADRKPRRLELRIEATVKDGQILGTYWSNGELGPDKDVIKGTIKPVVATVANDNQTSDPTASADLAGLCTLGQRTVLAYRQMRAAAQALHEFPVSYELCLVRNRVSLPIWNAAAQTKSVPGNGGGVYTIADAAGIIAEIPAVAEHMARIATSYDPAQAGICDYAKGPTMAENDPRFGPYFTCTPLADDEAGVPTLPEDTGKPGPQSWQYLKTWQVTGPFPEPLAADYLEPRIPEWVPTRFATYQVRSADFSNSFVHPEAMTEAEAKSAYNPYSAGGFLEKYQKPELVTFHTHACKSESGRWKYSLLPPRWTCAGTKVPLYGTDRGFFFAAAELRSPKELQVWAECSPNDAAQVWVNDRLVWHSLPDQYGDGVTRLYVFPVKLVAGINRLVVRCRGEDGQNHFRLTFCTQGRPNNGPTAIKPGSMEGIFHGFRGNGTGFFPAPAKGRPPLAWNLEKNLNVRWRVEMPSYSHSNPVIVGDRVFTNSDPHWLFCFDKMSGKELWRRSASKAELIKDPAEAARYEASFELLTNYNAKKGIMDPELDAWLKERRAVELQLAEADDRTPPADKEAWEKTSAALKAKIEAKQLTLVKQAGLGGWTDFTGLSMSSPVSDGTHIWVRYAAGGTVACFDLEGNRKWLVETGMESHIACVSSPVLIGRRLLVEGELRRQHDRNKVAESIGATSSQGTGGESIHSLLCLDADSGKELWEAFTRQGIGDYGGPGGPRATRLPLPDGSLLDLVISSRTLLRAEDGKVVLEGHNAGPGYTGWIDGSRSPGGCELWLESRDQAGYRMFKRGLSGYSYGGVVRAADGNFYGSPNPKAKAGRTVAPWMALRASDGVTSQRFFDHNQLFDDASIWDYTPAAACGDYVYLTDSQYEGKHGKGHVAVIKTGKGLVPQCIGRSLMDAPVLGCPVLDDARLYIRSRLSLTCLETTTDEGRKYEYNASVQEMFYSPIRLPIIPTVEMQPLLPPAAGYEPPAGVPVYKVHERCAPNAFLVCGPLPVGGPDPFAAVGGAAAIRPIPGQAIAGQTFTVLDQKLLQHRKGMVYFKTWDMKKYDENVEIDLTAVCERKSNVVYYFYTVLDMTKPRTMAYNAKSANITYWLAGRELVGDGQIATAIGYYPLVIRAEVGKIPPFAKDRKIAFGFSLTEQDGPDKAIRKWCNSVAPFKERLQALGESDASGDYKFQGSCYLKKLELFQTQLEKLGQP